MSTAAIETIHGAIRARAASRPEHVALRDGTRSLTYAQLVEESAALARRLIEQGVRPHDHVGIYLTRGTQLVVAVLGVLEAGAAYVPLDPDFPDERIRFMVEDAGVRVVVTESALEQAAPGATRVSIDAGHAASAVQTRLLPVVDPMHAAYVIYTSGSTGRPKGVRIAHRSVTNLLSSVAHEPGIAESDVWLAVTTLSFDISVLELFGPLAAGATTVVASREDVLDGRVLAHLLSSSGATIMQATPVTWRLLLETGWQGDARLKALCGGEALPPDLAADLVRRVGSLWNMYGPTETTIWSTCYRVPDTGAPILIGRPVASTSVYVLDAMLRPLPPGVPGEIWIGGAGVALGYHNRDDLTNERFRHDPFAGTADARMYRTGDHGRFLRDGNLEYRSRIDNQVKIRGYRVELGEIEAALIATGLVRQAAVVVHRGDRGDDRLVAFLVGGADVDALRAALRQTLPGYMVPQHFMAIDALPVTPNGKVDRRSLEASVETLPGAPSAFVAPRTPNEAVVAELYREVLGVERVNADDDFFDLGGHSVLAMRVVARLRELGAEALSLRDLFGSPAVSALAARLDALGFTAGSGATTAPDRELLVF